MTNYHPLKRRYSDLENETQHDQTFFLQNLATTRDVAFEPLSRLLRAHLPLSWLAPTSSTVDLSPASVLGGKVAYITHWEYSVLIARHAPNGGLVALEKFDDDFFVVHPLQPFVTDQWVKDASVGAAPLVCMQTMLHYIQEPVTTTKPELTPTLESMRIPEKLPKNRRGIAARISILGSPDIRDVSPMPTPKPVDEAKMEVQQTPEGHLPEQNISRQPEGTSGLDQNNVTEHATAAGEEVSDFLSPAYLRQRYLEHLYKSKTSLGYYTKGPLSRARARSRAPESSMSLPLLASFYRDSVLPSKKMDVKYKDSIKEIVKKITFNSGSHSDTKTKPKVSRKTKLGKDGLWPNESDYIAEWWRSRVLKPNPTPEQHDAELRDALATLRIREAQMQIILILETMSIEAKGDGQDRSTVGEPVKAESDTIEQDVQLLQPKSKAKHRNLESDLDILADKLCIWHSVGLENVWVAGDISGNRSDHDADGESMDRLRTFCTDIIMMFYNAKLPLICRSLCKTLSGSDVLEQFQKSSRFKQASSQSANTGKAIERRTPSMSRALERVLSEGSGRHSSPPTLMRSSTLPPVAQLKREPSDIPQRPASRPSRQNSVSLTNREVDLIADANATTSKRRKLEMVAFAKREAEAAIQALKKPNRAGAGRTYMDEIESRKLLNKKEIVQITATPRTNRISTLSSYQEIPQLPAEEGLVPSSTTKTKGLGSVQVIPRSSATKRAVLAAIRNTPSRNAENRADSIHAVRSVGHSQTQSMPVSPELIFATPQKVKKTITAVTITPENRARSPCSGDNGFKVTEMAFKAMQRAMGEDNIPNEGNSSIYDTLGWNDDYDI